MKLHEAARCTKVQFGKFGGVHARRTKRSILSSSKTGRRTVPWQQVVDEFLTQGPREERNESVLDAAIRLGVAGSVVGGPEDLATNPIHMEGFGDDKR